MVEPWAHQKVVLKAATLVTKLVAQMAHSTAEPTVALMAQPLVVQMVVCSVD